MILSYKQTLGKTYQLLTIFTPSIKTLESYLFRFVTLKIQLTLALHKKQVLSIDESLIQLYQ